MAFDFGSTRAHAREGGPLTNTHKLATLMLLGAATVPVVAQNGPAAPERPAWVVDGVPETVWTAVESAIAEKDKDRAKSLLKGAEVEARAAVAAREGDVGPRFALAVVLGLRTEREGGKTKIGIAAELKKELEATLAIDPEHGRARHMRGRLNAAVLRMNRVTRWLATSVLGGGELKKATWVQAEHDLAFAETRVPEVNDHHLQLAYLYRDTKRPALAMNEVEHVLAMPFQSATERAVHDEALKLKKRLH